MGAAKIARNRANLVKFAKLHVAPTALQMFVEKVMDAARTARELQLVVLVVETAAINAPLEHARLIAVKNALMLKEI